MINVANQIPAGRIDLFGPGAQFHHVGVAVRRIDDGDPSLVRAFDPVQNVSVAFADLHGVCVELIEPGGPGAPIASSLKKGIKLVHLCYTVPDIDRAVEIAGANGLMTLASPVPAVAFNGRRIAWMAHEVLGLFELLEAN